MNECHHRSHQERLLVLKVVDFSARCRVFKILIFANCSNSGIDNESCQLFSLKSQNYLIFVVQKIFAQYLQCD
jgi:hypothetical protein